jgi:hypothetical protein
MLPEPRFNDMGQVVDKTPTEFMHMVFNTTAEDLIMSAIVVFFLAMFLKNKGPRRR